MDRVLTVHQKLFRLVRTQAEVNRIKYIGREGILENDKSHKPEGGKRIDLRMECNY